MVDISKAFSTSSSPIAEFFQRPGIAYYIPLYQREYSWDEENIAQLMENIKRGVDNLLEGDTDDAIHFLGTVILVKENKPFEKIHPQDKKALPSSIYSVIDGQQRISTISLIACALYQYFYGIRNKLPDQELFVGVKEVINNNLDALQEIFSVDLKRGNPKRKPIIIRGSVDKWTFDESDDNYQSDISSFLAQFIRSVAEGGSFPRARKNSLVAKNLKEIDIELSKIENAHNLSDHDFPPAWEIIGKITEDYIWSYERPELVSIIMDHSSPISENKSLICSLVQLLAFTYYLSQRCCFTEIEPVSENRAFDMFQSLNATGTPLTALETFKPLVMNYLDEETAKFKGSNSETYFKQIDKLMSSSRSASAKNKLTNEYLTTLGLTRNGTKLPTKFSDQRKWLNKQYNDCLSPLEKEEFIHQMADLASYQIEVVGFKPNGSIIIPRTENTSDPDRKYAAFCLLYLLDSGHKMANAVLSRFYSRILREIPNSDSEFVNACKAIASYYTLWRSSLSNTGLDDTYRKLFQESISWSKAGTQLSVNTVKDYFRNCLENKGIGTKDDWMNKAKQYLRYDNVQKIRRFALFIASHDTIPDPSHPGMPKIGTINSNPILETRNWKSDSFKSIEHIAPQRPPSGHSWDIGLYDANDSFEQIGNLILLPIDINISAGNKSWDEKLIYYKHLAEKDPEKVQTLAAEASDLGITLKSDTLNILRNSDHSNHIEHIVGLQNVWNKSIVENRTERICSILWDRLYPWLS